MHFIIYGNKIHKHKKWMLKGCVSVCKHQFFAVDKMILYKYCFKFQVPFLTWEK